MLDQSGIDRLADEAAAGALTPLVPLRVRTAPTTDSTGAPALRVMIVLPDDYETRMPSSGCSKANLAVFDALAAAGDERLPLLEWATKSDLVNDGDPRGG